MIKPLLTLITAGLLSSAALADFGDPPDMPFGGGGGGFDLPIGGSGEGTPASGFGLSLSLDLQVNANVPRTCVWATHVGPSLLLESNDRKAAALDAMDLIAQCDTGTAFTVRAGADSVTMEVGGETLTLATYSDHGRSAPYSSGPGYTGVAVSRAPFVVPIYLRLTGAGTNGGFMGAGGELPVQQFKYTINY